jgi:hypothetical protein
MPSPAWPCRDLRRGLLPLPLRDAWRDDGGRAPIVRGVRPSRDFLLRDVWLPLCGAVLRVRNVLRPYDDDLLPALTYVLLP